MKGSKGKIAFAGSNFLYQWDPTPSVDHSGDCRHPSRVTRFQSKAPDGPEVKESERFTRDEGVKRPNKPKNSGVHL